MNMHRTEYSDMLFYLRRVIGKQRKEREARKV